MAGKTTDPIDILLEMGIDLEQSVGGRGLS